MKVSYSPPVKDVLLCGNDGIHGIKRSLPESLGQRPVKRVRDRSLKLCKLGIKLDDGVKALPLACGRALMPRPASPRLVHTTKDPFKDRGQPNALYKVFHLGMTAEHALTMLSRIRLGIFHLGGERNIRGMGGHCWSAKSH